MKGSGGGIVVSVLTVWVQISRYYFTAQYLKNESLARLKTKQNQLRTIFSFTPKYQYQRLTNIFDKDFGVGLSSVRIGLSEQG